MPIDCNRPFSCERLSTTACDVARNTHSDWPVPREINYLQRFADSDLRIAPIIQLAFGDLELPDDAVAFVAQDRFEEADLQ